MAYRNPTDQKHAVRRHYLRNKDRMKARAKRSDKDRRAKNNKFLKHFKDKPCMDCGLRFPTECMELDHVKGSKEANISNAKQDWGIKRLLREIEKCELVCANCHRIRTFNRRRANRENNVPARQEVVCWNLPLFPEETTPMKACPNCIPLVESRPINFVVTRNGVDCTPCRDCSRAFMGDLAERIAQRVGRTKDEVVVRLLTAFGLPS